MRAILFRNFLKHKVKLTEREIFLKYRASRIEGRYTAEGAESAEGRAEEDRGRVREMGKLSVLRGLGGRGTELRIEGRVYRRDRAEIGQRAGQRRAGGGLEKWESLVF
jgi:hypothetical protein